ncbi:DNA translocase FtsK [Aneurinibacillus sp. BA2021]|nr:DNA translocase FtsK [Aneurinibacillus sp. BA2021]
MHEEEYEPFEPQIAPIPVSGKHLTIRTANIYPKQTVTKDIERRKSPKRKKTGPVEPDAPLPAHSLPRRKREKGHFPFPLIPDDRPPRQSEKGREIKESPVQHIPHAVPRERKVPVQPFSAKEAEPVHEKRVEAQTEPPRTRKESKRPFRPTEVISPIYGRKRPEEKKEEAEPIAHTLIHPMEYKQQAYADAPNARIEEKRVQVEEPEILPIPEEAGRSVIEQSMPTAAQKEEALQSTALPAFEQEQSPARPMFTAVPVEKPMRQEPPQWRGPSTSMPAPVAPVDGTYERPALSLLMTPPKVQTEDTEYTNRQRNVLATTLHNFNVNAEVIGAVRGPTVTRYEIQPAPGVKVNKITNLIDDIKLSLAARDVRIEAPIPGRSAVGIEVPNEHSEPVFLRSILESDAFQEAASPLTVALGMDIGGEPIVADLAKMPHGLIAGATGSGKSVCINSIILSLLYKSSPDQVRLLLVDPKMVELAPYNHLPHLVTPVVTDPKQATAALKWAVQEMDSRYEKFAEAGARDISRYNDLMRRAYPDAGEYLMPSIVIIIDELADLMMVAPHDVEEAICRIAQKARACGIHLLVATQRPSVDVITGLIKANIPTRIAFSVSSQTDSRTILDMNGAERLLGRGDMLYLSSGSAKPVRLQGPYVSDDEIESVTEQVRRQAEPNYLFEKEDLTQAMVSENTDELFAEVVRFCVENGQASASLLQRNFQVGYNRAARLIDMMEEKGFISGQTGNSKPRDVFLTMAEYEELFGGEAR